MTKIIARYANEMARRGKNVKIFVENKCYEPNEFFIENTYGSGVDAIEFQESNKRMFREGIEICYASGKNTQEKTKNFVGKLSEYNPEVIFYYNAESSCITQSLFDEFPIVNVPTIQMGSNASCHMLAAINKNNLLEIDEKYKFIDSLTQIEEYPLCVVEPDKIKEYSREDFNISKEDFVIITVGNRLEYEIKNDLIDIMCNLSVYEHFVWLLVGCKSIRYIDDFHKELIDKGFIRYISYEEDLCALYKICDVYLNPRRIGGGTSIAWAMMEELPVLTIKEVSAGLNWVGEELAIKGDYTDIVEELLNLYRDGEYRVRKKKEFLRRIEKFNIKESTKGLLQIADKAINIFYNLTGEEH